MTFTPDGETMITVGDDKNIRFWPALARDDEDGIESELAAKHSIVTKVGDAIVKYVSSKVKRT
jgi:hypothetical protein